MSSLKDEEIKKISKLARILLSDEEAHDMRERLDTVIDWIDLLKTADVSHIDLYEHYTMPQMHEREDIAFPLKDKRRALENAPHEEHHMFVVPKVVT